jgi:hypothetical protein
MQAIKSPFNFMSLIPLMNVYIHSVIEKKEKSNMELKHSRVTNKSY